VRWGRGREDKNLVIDGGGCGGAGATTVDITEPDWRLIKTGAIDEKEIADCLKPS
jgi:L-threonylcarbamoyladenylate synthase